jgi:hypothetical protein
MSYDLKISPQQATQALDLLALWIQERKKLLDLEGDSCQITSAVQGVRLMDALFRMKEQLQDLVKTPIEAAYDTLRFTVIPKLMDAEGIPTVTVAGVGRVHLQDDVQVKVLNQGGLRDWLVANEFEDMIKPTVNAQTLSAFVRKRLAGALDLPGEAVIDVKPITRAQITRAGVK